MAALDKELKVTPLQYTVQRGEQTDEASYEAMKKGDAFTLAGNGNSTPQERRSIPPSSTT